jgi:hypothetical protein
MKENSAFAKYLQLEQDRVNDTRKTQVATTGGTYEKTGKFLADKLKPGSKIISIGAGLEHTKKALSSGLGAGHSHTIHDMEPNPQGRKEAPEFTKAEEIPKNHYHAAVSHNVLNVVEPHVREHVMHSIFHSIKEGGHAVIGTRKFKGDIDKAKNSEPAAEPKAIWVKKGNTASYQKGFDGNELKDYVHDYAKRHGHSVTVTKLSGIAANAVHVHLHKKGNTMNEGMDDYDSYAKELIKRHGKKVTKQHIKDLDDETSRDSDYPLDHDQVMDAVKKRLREERAGRLSMIKKIMRD